MPSTTSYPRVLSSSTLTGDKVINSKGDDLGKIEELMIDLNTGVVAYAVLSFGGFLGMGNKLFAIPWAALRVDTLKKRIVLNLDKETLRNAPGFDKDHWPDMTLPEWHTTIYQYYRHEPYWEDTTTRRAA